MGFFTDRSNQPKQQPKPQQPKSPPPNPTGRLVAGDFDDYLPDDLDAVRQWVKDAIKKSKR